mgnify:CR=1 FL=1
MSIRRTYHFDQVGAKDMYLLHHEEIESLAKIRRVHIVYSARKARIHDRQILIWKRYIHDQIRLVTFYQSHPQSR